MELSSANAYPAPKETHVQDKIAVLIFAMLSTFCPPTTIGAIFTDSVLNPKEIAQSSHRFRKVVSQTEAARFANRGVSHETRESFCANQQSKVGRSFSLGDQMKLAWTI